VARRAGAVPGGFADGDITDDHIAVKTATYPEEIRQVMGGRDPTEEQWRAISMPLEPCVVVAGAGSGKTSVIAARVVYLALAATGRIEAGHTGVLPGNVLCLTFTNKATENLVLRIRGALHGLDLPEGEEPTIANYHGFAAQILERHGLLAGIESNQRVLTPAQRTELCARVLEDLTFEHVSAEWQPSLVAKILELADQAANHRREPDEIVEFNEQRLQQLAQHRSDAAHKAALERIELARAVKRFQELKREIGAIDFGDQITHALDVVERFPEVSQDYRSRYLAVVLDEYQDTNVAQAQLIGSVFGDGFPVTAVGDPDQSIYGWRGASLFNLLEFRSQFSKADGSSSERLPLYTNFRSGARILATADVLIDRIPEAQRPDPEKELEPWPPLGSGAVELQRFPDEWTEARWIAARVVELHTAGAEPNWSDFAVLCRTSRLFVSLQEAFAELAVPVEVVGLVGLLKMPEVVEILAYAWAVADPYASVSLARILLGPRYRVGFKDLARVAAWAKDRNYERRDADREETAPFLFAEALEHLDEVTDLSEEGRARLEEFRVELGQLRAEARRSVGEFLAEVIRRIGLLGELDSSPDAERALATKRNLAAFLDEVHAFSPLEGELTLRAFLDYVDTALSGEKEEWSPPQPSTENSVKVMTIHQAKGLEFGTVFVPGLAKDLLPNLTVQQNPAERGKSLDFELRGDAAILPTFQGNLKQFWLALRSYEEMEERRTAYVALTRAKRRLVVTGAHWYGEGQFAKAPSIFLEELFAWAEQEPGRAEIDRGDEPPEDNPLIGYRERFVRDWPGPARRVEGDALFPRGWRTAAAEAEADPAMLDAMAGGFDDQQGQAYQQAREQLSIVAANLVEREAEGGPGATLPGSVAVGGVIEYTRCPKRFYWSAVRPLPRFSGPAARLGTQVHAWIERSSSGQASLLELEEAPDLSAEELAGEPGKLDRLQRAWAESRFSTAPPLFAERPFLLYAGGFVVSGRIDAIFGTPEGPWEVVDYKTGKMPPKGDVLAGLQLDIYALACTDVWHKRAEDLTLTYFYLASGQEVTRRAGDPGQTRSRVASALAGIAERRFDPTPGDQCRWCDFLSFCDAGKAFVEATLPDAGP
jgi:DNA helicase-2/ATP-dependent DNA helicase PcrA